MTKRDMYKKNLKFGYKLFTFLLILSSTLGTNLPRAFAVENNLIANPSLEQADIVDPNLPDNWFSGAWGSNVNVFSYPVIGHNSPVAANIQINTYVDGDAKWYFADVVVDPTKDYYFEDYYISDVETNLIARYTDSIGGISYENIAVVDPSTTWAKAKAIFYVPEDTASVTIFHTLSQDGALTVDDAALLVQEPATITDFVPNNSMEETVILNPDLPLDWNTAGYGNNTATFEYINDAHDGDNSLKLTLSDYVDGDAKWMYAPQTMPAGDYHFSAWYKSNTIPHVVAQFTRADNSVYYFGMPNPQPQGEDWQNYSSEFTVPIDAVKVNIFLFLSNNGWLAVDDFHITPYTYEGFDNPMVTLSFDDGTEGNVVSVLPVLESYGFKSTHCYTTEPVEGFPANILNVQSFDTSGHEICSHSITHPFLTQLTTEEVDYELSHSQEFLQSIVNQPVSSFAAPYGDYNEAVNNQIAEYYQVHRGVEEGFNSKDNLNLYRLRVQNMRLDTSFEQYQAWVNKAIADKTWLIFVYHKVGNEDLEVFDTLQADFDQQMEWLDSTGVTVKTLAEASQEALAQIIAAPTTPIATPDSGEYSGSIILTSDNADFINYTLDNSDPTCEQGILYVDPIELSDDSTVKAIACNEYHESAVAEFVYTMPDTTAPVISLAGEETVNLTVGQTYIESGATAVDDVDGDLTDEIIITGIVDTSLPGTYYIQYNVSDNAGNPATEVVRTVIVKKSIPPIILPNPTISGGGGGFILSKEKDILAEKEVLGQKEVACDTDSLDCAAGGDLYQSDSDYIYLDVTQREQNLQEDVDNYLVNRLNGRILLQTETLGQAWYLDPLSLQRYYLPDGYYAYLALKKFGLGISNADIAKIPVGHDSRFVMQDTDDDGLADLLEEALGTDPNKADTDDDGALDGEEVLNYKTNPLGVGYMNISNTLVNKLKGRILLQVESRGEAWYVNPVDGKRYYMNNGEAAYQIMRYLSLGISNKDIVHIPVGKF